MTSDPPSREYGLLDQTVDEPPPVLWHYTDSGGFFGIVNSGTLRFGSAGFLNDQTEREYGWRVVNDVLDEEIRRNDHLSGFFRFVKEITDPVQFSGHTFVSSLSERNESISQWQRYGADGRGYCLGLNVRQILATPEFRQSFCGNSSTTRQHSEKRWVAP